MVKNYMMYIGLLVLVTLMILLLISLPLGIELQSLVGNLVWSG